MPNYFSELKIGPEGPSYKVKDEEADRSITALIEESPATEAHNIDTYLVYNREIYHVKAAISIGDTLTVGTNIEVADIPEGTIIFTDDESSAPAGCVAHVIVNDSGVTMAQRNKLKFVGLDVTDDSENDTTVISNQKTNDAVEAITDVYGAKNLLPVTLSNLKANNTSGTWSGNTYTYRGVTFTCTTSGDIVTLITMNGTSTARTDFTWPVNIGSGNYIVNGIPSGADTDSIYYLMQRDGSWGAIQENEKREIVNTSITFFGIRVVEGYTANNLTFYPMIRDARIADPTYVPYAKTNKQLTDELINMNLLVENSGSLNVIGVMSKYKQFLILAEGTLEGSQNVIGVSCIIATNSIKSTLWRNRYPMFGDGLLYIEIPGSSVSANGFNVNIVKFDSQSTWVYTVKAIYGFN